MRSILVLGFLAVSAPSLVRAGQGDDAWKVYLKGDYKKAHALAEPAAKAGDAAAQATLGTLYLHGQGVERDYAASAKWFRLSAEQGNAGAQNGLAWMYQNGFGVKLDLAEAGRWYLKSAQGGYEWGQNGAGWALQNGWGFKKDSVEAAKWFRKAAEQGNAGGQHGLGNLYQIGEGVEQDSVEAAKWYRKSAEQGNQHGQGSLGWLYEAGLGVEKDMAKAIEWYRKSAEQGSNFSQGQLGNIYYHGMGVGKDHVEAAKWYRKAAEQGNYGSQHMLGWLYWIGSGVKQDYAEAAAWMLKSAEQGYQHAQAGIGCLYRLGLGVKMDFVQAEKWLRKSAEQGNAHGQKELAVLYENGQGVVQDYVQAYRWNLLAASQDLAEARQGMERLKPLMTKEAVAEAQKLASAFKAAGSAVQAPAPAPMAPERALVSEVDHPSYHRPEDPKAFALVVGVEGYKDLPSAEFAQRDAEAVKEHLLALGYPERNVVLLKGSDATVSGLKKFVDEWLPRNVPEGGSVFFYFSGHGAPDPKTGDAYIIPWDGDPRFLKSTAYPVRKLYASLANLPARKVWVALDSCFSGAGGRSVLAKGSRPLVAKVDSALPSKGKLVLFAAASKDEITGTLESEGHGIFTYHFLKALAEQSSKELDASLLFKQLKSRVQDDARRQNRDQTPVLAGGLDGR
ncbi:MAG: SEL1-like repeat protein [Elusimicrobia bacterium]|nr:SEL1-like repeat protein [Elusimicrobiota bacterium]